jgi:aryl-phospho-beta-D-glucosidase BglC (GH1 family)
MKFISFAFFLAAIMPVIAMPVPAINEEMDEEADDEVDECDASGGEPETLTHHNHRHHHSQTIDFPTSFPTVTPVSADPPFPTGFSTGVSLSALPTISIPASSPTVSLESPSTVVSASSSLPAATTTATSSSPTKPTGSSVLRGVNIGNWLILEKWMDDGSVFTGKFANADDQWSFDSIDTDGSAIKQHWDSYFTEADVQKLSSYGFNALRIPIGYWAFNNSGTPYNTGASDYLEKALGWAQSAGMKVLIDCHGSPGSQNGQQHSGHQGAIDWQKGENLDASTAVLQQMVTKFGQAKYSDVVFGIEIVSKYILNPV